MTVWQWKWGESHTFFTLSILHQLEKVCITLKVFWDAGWCFLQPKKHRSLVTHTQLHWQRWLYMLSCKGGNLKLSVHSLANVLRRVHKQLQNKLNNSARRGKWEQRKNKIKTLLFRLCRGISSSLNLGWGKPWWCPPPPVWAILASSRHLNALREISRK